MTLRAITDELLDLVERIKRRWRARIDAPQYALPRLPDSELTDLARLARLEASESIANAERIGERRGYARAYQEMGAPVPGEPGPETPTSPGLACMLCGQRRPPPVSDG